MLTKAGAPQGLAPARVDFEAARKRLTGHRAIILEEDSESFGRMFVALANAGCAAVLARRWAQVEAAIPRHQPTLVIFSTELGELDAGDIIRRLRLAPATERAILVAAAPQESRKERRRLLALGCNGYVWKPADRYLFAAELVARTPALLEARGQGPDR